MNPSDPAPSPTSPATASAKPSAKRKLVGAVVSISLAFAAWHFATRSPYGVGVLSMLCPPLVPSSRLSSNLETGDSDLMRESLSILADRRTPVAAETALPLLGHPDAYVWLNAALYLGSVRRSEATPYLIKALRHQASRSHVDAGKYLRDLTGNDFGTDFTRWNEWWLKSNPGSNFDFDHNLGP